MEELAGSAPSGNLRTPFETAKNRLIIARAELAKAAKYGHGLKEAHQKFLKATKNLERAEKAKSLENLYNSGELDYIYIIVEGDDLETFIEDVMQKMAEGYILQGGLSSGGSRYTQALVKSKKNDVAADEGGGGGGERRKKIRRTQRKNSRK